MSGYSLVNSMLMHKYKFETNRQLLVNFKESGYKGPFSLRWTCCFLRNSLSLHQARDDMLAVPHKVKPQLHELIKRELMFDGPNTDLINTVHENRRLAEARGMMLNYVSLRQVLCQIHGPPPTLSAAGTIIPKVNYTEEELSTQALIHQLDEKIYGVLQNKEGDKQVAEYAAILLGNTELEHTPPKAHGIPQRSTLFKECPSEIVDLAVKLVQESGAQNHVSSARLINKRLCVNERLSGELWRHTINGSNDDGGLSLRNDLKKKNFQMPSELLEHRSCSALDRLGIGNLLKWPLANEAAASVEWETGPAFTANFAAIVRGLSAMEAGGDDTLNVSSHGNTEATRVQHITEMWAKAQDAMLAPTNALTGKNHLTLRSGLGVYQTLMSSPTLANNMTKEVTAALSQEWERLILGTHLNLSNPLHFSGSFYEPMQTYPKEDPKTGMPVNQPFFHLPDQFDQIGERLKRYYCGGGRQAHNAMYLDQLQRSGVSDADFAKYAWNFITNSLRVVHFARSMGMGGDQGSAQWKRMQGIVDTANEVGMSLQMGKLCIPQANLGALTEASSTVSSDLEYITLMKSPPVEEDMESHNGEALKNFPLSALPRYLSLCDKRTVQKSAESRKGVAKLEAPRVWLEGYLTSHNWENMKQLPLDTLNQLVGIDTLALRGEEPQAMPDIFWRRPHLMAGGVKREVERRRLTGQPSDTLSH